jgi:hypothetical protein
MNATTLLNQIITEELSKIEQNGEKVKLKSVRKKRITSAIILGILALIWFSSPETIILSVICIGIFIFINVNTDKVKTIAKLAQKMPDTPIDEIIRGEMI